MRAFNYSKIRDNKWDSELLGLIAAIYKEMGKQELYLKQRPEELEKLVEIAKIQSTEASNAIEGIVTTNTRIRQLVEEKTTLETATNKKLRAIGMCWKSSTKTLMQSRLHGIIFFNFIKFSIAI